MCIEFPGKKNKDKQVDQLLDTFRNQFWLEKHQWYVRCHRMSHEKYGTIFLCTIPYGFVDFYLNMLTTAHKSTCPQDNDYDLYHQVKNLSYISSMECLSFIQFSHIRNLSIELYFDKKLWKNISSIPSAHIDHYFIN
jgi:hypothetical protein